jgi:CheY-like chemotaxis protein
MRVLVADDDANSRTTLNHLLSQWGYAVTAVADGAAAWEVLQQTDAPRLLLIGVRLPRLDGAEVCRRVRVACPAPVPPYLLCLADQGCRDDVRAGLEAGADDYLLKPVDPLTVEFRLRVGRRFLALQERQLRNGPAPPALVPVCAWCKKVRNVQGQWAAPEGLLEHLGLTVTHTICPDCLQRQLATLPAGLSGH